MKLELAAIVLVTIIAVVILLLFCCFRHYASHCETRGTPQALQFDDDLSRRHLLEEGEDEPPNRRSPSQEQRPPPQSRYFVLGGHRFEATANGYRQIDDEASYEANEAQKLALHADDSHINFATNNEDMVGTEENPKPRKTRHPLAVQFSAMAHAAEAETSRVAEPNSTRQFMHDITQSDNYIWPSKGGPATPIHVEWSGNTYIHPAKEQNLGISDEHISSKEESQLDASVNETATEDLAQNQKTEENPELLVKTDHHIVPKPKSKKGKRQQLTQEEQITS